MRQPLDAPLTEYLKTPQGQVPNHPWNVGSWGPSTPELRNRLYPGEPPIVGHSTGLTLSPVPQQSVLPPRGRNAAVGDRALAVPRQIMDAWQGRIASPAQLAMGGGEQRPMGDPQAASRRGINTSLGGSRERIPGSWRA